MKNSIVVFFLQMAAGLCAASTAQAQSLAPNVPLTVQAAHLYAAASTPMCQVGHGDQVGFFLLNRAPMTLPAGVNYEVGRGGGGWGSPARAWARQPAFEVELWTVTPKVLRFSRSGRLLAEKK